MAWQCYLEIARVDLILIFHWFVFDEAGAGARILQISG